MSTRSGSVNKTDHKSGISLSVPHVPLRQFISSPNWQSFLRRNSLVRLTSEEPPGGRVWSTVAVNQQPTILIDRLT